MMPPSPNRCPTPCVLLARMDTFIDLFFVILALLAIVSAILLLGVLAEMTRR